MMQVHLTQFFPLGMADVYFRWAPGTGFRVLRALRRAFRFRPGERRCALCPQA